MGKRGPAPQPSILKYIRGNPSKEALNSNEPTPDILEEWEPPWHVGADELATRKWNEAVPVLVGMMVLTKADVEPLARYCLTWSGWIKARELCESEGHYIISYNEDKNGNKTVKWAQPAPWSVAEKAARKDLLQLEREFGMTPSSRSQVTIHSNAQDDPLTAFVEERSDRAGA